ncbi:MAG: hypothetical protein JSV96_11425 [Candidatus Aminicenantes bacterium]|nr:MAG: hypothetical protein JSV96_11425 [Candidatus Aminicenantes bacterium]
MKKIYLLMILILIFELTCSNAGNQTHYLSHSRYTDPKEYGWMLDELPSDVTGICEIVKQQIAHHNLLPYYNVPSSKGEKMPRGWPPVMTELLKALKEIEPYNVYESRPVEQRIIGSCSVESRFLAGLLRHKNIPARYRAGYFKNTMGNVEHIVRFWENVSRARGVERELMGEDPAAWKETMNAITMREQIEADKHIEHWICEYWDNNEKRWRLLDANNTFLKASSGLDVSFHLPKKYYEFAYEAWMKMRSSEDFNPDQYQEYPQDGRTHIKKSLLWDYYSLLNHDIGSDLSPQTSYEFTLKNYEELSKEELEELDRLANLLSNDPTKEELVTFYQNSKTLKIKSAEEDPYSFVFQK